MEDYPGKYQFDPHPSRSTSKAEKDKLIQILLVNLADQEQSTDPSSGADTEFNKDRKAFFALTDAARLVRLVAGWAIDHSVGLAIEGRAHTNLQPPGTASHPDAVVMKVEADSHRHEIAGREYSLREIFDPDVARQSIVNLMSCDFDAVPFGLRDDLIESLTALKLGDVLPLVEPAREGRKRGHRLSRLQLKAIGFIEYRVTRGMTRKAATDRVAHAYGRLSPGTVRNWEYQLRERLGHLAVDRARSFAQDAGRSADAAVKRNDRAMFESKDNWYGDEALLSAGGAFYALQQEQKAGA